MQVYRAQSSLVYVINTFLVLQLISFSQGENYLWRVMAPSLAGWKRCPQTTSITWNENAPLPPMGPWGLLNTHIFIFSSLCVWNSTGRKTHALPVTGLSQLAPSGVKRASPHLRRSSPTPALSQWLVSQTLLLLLSPLTNSTLSNPLPSTHWSSISPWPWTIIPLHPWTLSRTFISIHLFNGIVNDLRGVNHSQDNGCKKLIDMIFMI